MESPADFTGRGLENTLFPLALDYLQLLTTPCKFFPSLKHYEKKNIRHILTSLSHEFSPVFFFFFCFFFCLPYSINPIQGNLESRLVERCDRRRRSAHQVPSAGFEPRNSTSESDALPTELPGAPLLVGFYFVFFFFCRLTCAYVLDYPTTLLFSILY